MKTQGPEIKITSSCANCQFLDRREEGKRNRYIPDGNPPLFYSCRKSSKDIGYLSDIMNTPDWCEFKTINIQNLLKELKL